MTASATALSLIARLADLRSESSGETNAQAAFSLFSSVFGRPPDDREFAGLAKLYSVRGGPDPETAPAPTDTVWPPPEVNQIREWKDAFLCFHERAARWLAVIVTVEDGSSVGRFKTREEAVSRVREWFPEAWEDEIPGTDGTDGEVSP